MLRSSLIWANSSASSWQILALLVLAIVALIAFLFLLPFVSIWTQAHFSGVKIPFVQIVGMKLRKTDPRTIVINAIRCEKAGLDVSIDQLETHALAGGRVSSVVSAMIGAQKASIPTTWGFMTAVDLAGHDVLGAVNEAVNDREILVPAAEKSGAQPFERVHTHDGQPVRIRVQIRVLTCLERLVGGADEPELIEHTTNMLHRIVGALDHADPRLTDEKLAELLARAELGSGTRFTIKRIEAQVRRY